MPMKALKDIIENASSIESKIGHIFHDRSLLALAFIHRSYVNENREITDHNERLEFLGDSVLGVLVAEYLYRYLPATAEGELSFLRSRLVEASSCVTYIQKLGIDEYLLLGKGERMNDGRGRESILADFFEAVIGAVYLDGGFDAAYKFFFGNFKPEIEAILKMPLSNWKAVLQDYCQKKYQTIPKYKVIEEKGPDHSKMFLIAVCINDEVLGQGTGTSKKEAQQAAAEDALSRCNVKEKDHGR